MQMRFRQLLHAFSLIATGSSTGCPRRKALNSTPLGQQRPANSTPFLTGSLDRRERRPLPAMHAADLNALLVAAAGGALLSYDQSPPRYGQRPAVRQRVSCSLL